MDALDTPIPAEPCNEPSLTTTSWDGEVKDPFNRIAPFHVCSSIAHECTLSTLGNDLVSISACIHAVSLQKLEASTNDHNIPAFATHCSNMYVYDLLPDLGSLLRYCTIFEEGYPLVCHHSSA